MQLSGQTFVVTGGAAGLGAATAHELILHGARVVVVDHNAVAGRQTIAQWGAAARFVAADVTDGAQVQTALDTAVREFGDLHGVIHCAGVLAAGKLLGKTGILPAAEFERILQVNLLGTFIVLSRAAAMLSINQPNADGERGVIILTGSVAAAEGQIGQAAYAASKGGVHALTLPAARELARCGVRVVTIAPGIMETDLMRGASDEVRSSLVTQVVFPQRFGQPREFAALARHVLQNGYLNGCVLRLDGGLRMGPK